MLNRKNKLKNKKAQVGQTTFWLVATIIIIAILIIFIFVSTILASINKFSSPSKAVTGLEEESQILSTKTDLAFRLNHANRMQIEEILKQS